jgi:hypothetical protein
MTAWDCDWTPAYQHPPVGKKVLVRFGNGDMLVAWFDDLPGYEGYHELSVGLLEMPTDWTSLPQQPTRRIG